MTLLTPLCALAALLALLPLGAALVAHARTDCGAPRLAPAARDATRRAAAVRACCGRHRSPRARGGTTCARAFVESARAQRRAGALRARHVALDGGFGVADCPDATRSRDGSGRASACRDPAGRVGSAHPHRPSPAGPAARRRHSGIRRSRPARRADREPAATRHECPRDDLRRARRHPERQRLCADGVTPHRRPPDRRREQPGAERRARRAGSPPTAATASWRFVSGGAPSRCTTPTASPRPVTAPTPPARRP